MSSTIIQVLPLTLPITFITFDFPGAGLLLSTIANSTFNNLPRALALSVPPTSGATQMILFPLQIQFHWMKTAHRLDKKYHDATVLAERCKLNPNYSMHKSYWSFLKQDLSLIHI